MTMRRRIYSGTIYEELAGYSRAVVDGDWVHVSGTTGIDPADGSIPEDVVAQTHQIFRNIEWALAEAGSSLADVVRIRVYLDSRDDFPTIAPIIGDYMRDVRPANTTVVAALCDARMKIEIEVTAHNTKDQR